MNKRWHDRKAEHLRQEAARKSAGRRTRSPRGATAASWTAGAKRIAAAIRKVGAQVNAAMEAERVLVEISKILEVDPEEAYRIAGEHGAETVRDAGVAGWLPGHDLSPRLFLLVWPAGRVSR